MRNLWKGGLVQIQSSVHRAWRGFTTSVVLLRGVFKMWLIFFKCTKCTSSVDITQTAEIKDVEIGVNEKLECAERFCYLRDM